MEDVLQLTRTNITANLPLLQCACATADFRKQTCTRVTASPLRWEKFVPEASALEAAQNTTDVFDVIILSDVVWYMEGVIPLVSTLRALAHARSLIIFCFQSRHLEVDLVFWDLIGRYFSVSRLPSAHMHPEFRTALVSVYEFIPLVPPINNSELLSVQI